MEPSNGLSAANASGTGYLISLFLLCVQLGTATRMDRVGCDGATRRIRLYDNYGLRRKDDLCVQQGQVLRRLLNAARGD